MADESRFAKIARVTVTGSAANTLTFAEFQTGVGLTVGATRGKGLGWLIDQIDYYCQNLSVVQSGIADILRMGVTTSNAISALEELDDQRILHAFELNPFVVTSGAGVRTQPHTFQFFPALLWAEPTLFFATDGESQGSAPVCTARIFYRIIELDQQLIFEVAQAFRVIS